MHLNFEITQNSILMNKKFNVTRKIVWLLAAALCPLAAGNAGAQDKLYAP